MANFRINFSNPWLLLLLILAGLLTFIPYFRLNKKYRFNRNRITSMILHIVIMFIAIPLLAGVTVEYDLPNDKNEVIVLVDASFSGEENEQDKNEFIEAIIDSNPGFRLGVVSFGYDQVYAVELTNDMSKVYTDYLKAPLPDTTATDLEAALNFAADKFENPETARIVLVSDAIETDGDSLKVIKSIAARGIEVDTVYFPDSDVDDEIQIIGMELPKERIEVGSAFNIRLAIQSSFAGNVTVVPYDNGNAGLEKTFPVTEGVQYVDIPFEFALPGLHKMHFELIADGDTLEMNNVFHSFVYLQIFDRVLILESNAGESTTLCSMLDGELKVTVMNISDPSVPNTVEGLREYDEIILCNIANHDMPDGFDKILQTYVREIGGGLFTICGNENELDENGEWTANAYTRTDMYGTIYQDMLPVEVIEYTPPTAIMFVIDRSGSMTTDESNRPLPENENKLLFAKKVATECIEAISDRDYIGVISFSDDYTEHIGLTSRGSGRDQLISAIDHINGSEGGGTVLSKPLEVASRNLASMTDVENKHIIIITDGEPSGSDDYKKQMEENRKNGITTSIIGINCKNSAKTEMKLLLTNYAGGTNDNFHDVSSLSNATAMEVIKKDFEVNKIKDVNYGEVFKPTIGKLSSSITAGLTNEQMPELNGFYGVKEKTGDGIEVDVILKGEYTPIYAQWKYGKGTVGTFACDLNGNWSADFVNSNVGVQIVNNIVLSLFPRETIRPADIELEVEGDNYTTQLNIYTDLAEDQTLEITVTSPAINGEDPAVQVITKGVNDAYTRVVFPVKTPGIHEIVVRKLNADGTLAYEAVTHKALSYSLEYNMFTDKEAAEALASQLADDGRGYVIEEPYEVYDHADKYIHVVIDPRIPLAIALIVLFLLDIAVRKFKWKWPHEIIRDRRARKAISRKVGG